MLRDSVLSVIARILGILFKMLSYILVAKYLGPAGQGIFSLAITVIITLTPIGALGLDFSNTYHTAKDGSKAGYLLINAGLISIIGGILLGLGYIALRNISNIQALEVIPRSFDLLIMLGIPIQIMFILFMSIAVGRRLFKDIVVATILNDGFFLIMLVFMAATSSITTRATFAVWSVVTLAANIYLMIRILRVSPVRSFRWRVFLVDFRYTMWRYSYSIINTLYSRADTYLVAQFLTPAHIGWYAMANSMGEALLNLPKALNLVVLSHTASDRLDQRRGRAAYRTVAIMLGGACLVLIAVAGYLIPALFTPAFSASVLPLRVLLIGVFWQGLAGMAVHQLYGLNDPVLPVVSSTIAFGVVVIAGFLLIPQLGLFGAALSAVLGKTVFMTVVFFRLNQQTGIGFASIFSYSSTDFQSLMKRLHSLRS